VNSPWPNSRTSLVVTFSTMTTAGWYLRGTVSKWQQARQPRLHTRSCIYTAADTPVGATMMGLCNARLVDEPQSAYLSLSVTWLNYFLTCLTTLLCPATLTQSDQTIMFRHQWIVWYYDYNYVRYIKRMIMINIKSYVQKQTDFERHLLTVNSQQR